MGKGEFVIKDRTRRHKRGLPHEPHLCEGGAVAGAERKAVCGRRELTGATENDGREESYPRAVRAEDDATERDDTEESERENPAESLERVLKLLRGRLWGKSFSLMLPVSKSRSFSDLLRSDTVAERLMTLCTTLCVLGMAARRAAFLKRAREAD